MSNPIAFFGPNYSPDFLIASILSDGNLGINAWNYLTLSANLALTTSVQQVLGTQVGVAWQGQGYMQLLIGQMLVKATAGVTVSMYLNISAGSGVTVQSDQQGSGTITPFMVYGILATIVQINAVYDIYMKASASVNATATAQQYGQGATNVGTALLSIVIPMPFEPGLP